jgi:hypothetical protein
MANWVYGVGIAHLKRCETAEAIGLLSEAIGLNPLPPALAMKIAKTNLAATAACGPSTPSSKNSQPRAGTSPGKGPAPLLSSLVGGYIEAFDEEPLPVAVADHAFQRLLDLVASLDFRASAEHRFADLNRVAACHLWH